MISNKRIIYTKTPIGCPVPGEHIQVQESTMDLDQKLPIGSFILKTLEISIDTYQIDRMHDLALDTAPPLVLNQPLADNSISVVVRSNNPEYKVDDLVLGRSNMGRFEEYVLVNEEEAKSGFVVRNDAKENNLPLSHYVGALAMSGMTAYYGLNEIGKPKKGDTVFVSAASAAVGQLVGQFAKAMNLDLRVVGTAGSDEKVAYLKSIGFDDAFNYKHGTLEENMDKYFPDGVDVYFDGVGGPMLDAVFLKMNKHGRIIACGMTSQYKLAEPDRLNNIMYLIFQSVKMEGFVVFDFELEYEEKFLREATPLLTSGAVKYRTEVLNGIDSVPEAYVKAYRGEKFGKMIVHIADL